MDIYVYLKLCKNYNACLFHIFLLKGILLFVVLQYQYGVPLTIKFYNCDLY